LDYAVYGVVHTPGSDELRRSITAKLEGLVFQEINLPFLAGNPDPSPDLAAYNDIASIWPQLHG
jgi:hypothetical protein